MKKKQKKWNKYQKNESQMRWDWSTEKCSVSVSVRESVRERVSTKIKEKQK